MNQPADPDQDCLVANAADLHDLILLSGKPGGNAEWIARWSRIPDRARQLLEAGADPNERSRDGASPLGFLGSLTRGTNPVAVKLAKMLVHAGANPLIGDKPLANVIKHEWASVLLTEVVQSIANMDRQGKPLLDDTGGNILHYFAKHDMPTASGFLRDDDVGGNVLHYFAKYGAVGAPGLLGEDDFDGTEEAYFPHGMINATNHAGDTPLHAVWRDWRKHGQLVDCWEMTYALLRRGADPMLLDASGMSVAQTIEDLANVYAPPADYEECWDRIRAPLEQSRLEAATAPRPVSPPGPRL